MAVQLSQADFQELIRILSRMPDFQMPDRRIDFIEDVFAGSPRQDDVVPLIDVNGAPRGVAVRLVTRLTQFGQDEPGRETLGVLINKMLSYLGGGDDAVFLQSLFTRYSLDGKPVIVAPLEDTWHGRGDDDAAAEKIIGENTLQHVRMLQWASTAALAVVRIRTPAGNGTGFLVGERLIMTNHHVLPHTERALASDFDFFYQLDAAGQETAVETIQAVENGQFYTNPRHKGLDMTVVEIASVPESVQPLKLARRRVYVDNRVNIIQHPGGEYKKISLQNNFVRYADTTNLQYLTSTKEGSSGSPVFDNTFTVVALHHSGGELLEPGTTQRFKRNAGTTMQAILDDLQKHAPAIYERLNIV